MASSHEEYKAEKRAEEKARKEAKQRRYSASRTSPSERANVRLTPGEEFWCLWFSMRAGSVSVEKHIRKGVVAAWIGAVTLSLFWPVVFPQIFLIVVVIHGLSLLNNLRQTRSAYKDVVTASELPNPQYDRKGRRLRDPDIAPVPTRTADEVLNAWDQHKRFGMGRPYDG